MTPVFDIACLCAAWCRLCAEYRATFESVATGFAAEGVRLRWHWIDVEDEADLVGDLDVETFPTILVVDGDARGRFLGALGPQPVVLSRLLRSVLDDVAAGKPAPALSAVEAEIASGLRERALAPLVER